MSNDGPAPVPTRLAARLYTSHFLSTWNSRLFEFGVVLFIASVFPGTLMPVSVYGLVRSAAAILFAQPVGSWIDSGNRLTVVRASIIGQRVSVVASCGIFWVLEQKRDGLEGRLKTVLFTVAVLLACVEKLCSMMNLISVERDWVVVITEDNEDARRTLNARMRRIDLLCKLLGPLAISTVAIASTLTAIWTTLAMNIVSVVVEYRCIAVYQMVPFLQRSPRASSRSDEEVVEPNNTQNASQEAGKASSWSSLKQVTHRILPISSLPFYFHHPAFLPSLSLSLLYLTVLSFSGQMITFLVSAGYTSLHVGIARTVSTIFELSATWIAPRLMNRIGVVRGGIWSLSWQMVWLGASISWFWISDSSSHRIVGDDRFVSATGLAIGVALSRVGLWGFDLCAQSIVQDEVEVGFRGSFSTVEAAFQSLFELMSFGTTIIFSRPDQFQWPVCISVAAVYLAGGLYTFFVRKRRGHLLHAPPCIRPKLDS
ncbi:Ferroporti-1 [Podospora didyma]|uniref:Solute carrier family 40 member n=1 Tax=Podospora didyma TaxID=330526 RepID=A0AAE0K1S4_9PEZI|nr:Ferroporti-1 [Podospora didyma]